MYLLCENLGVLGLRIQRKQELSPLWKAHHVPGPGSGVGEIDMQEIVTVPVLMEMKFQPGKCN